VLVFAEFWFIISARHLWCEIDVTDSGKYCEGRTDVRGAA
jgi:hypothetical protein